jgi:ribonuclease D
MKKYYVNSDKMLNELVKKASDKKIIAIDTEFTRQKTYYPVLSLIQVGIDKETYAVDCMSGIDLAPIYDLIFDEKVKKILHSCSQDLQIFHRDFDKFGQNIHDIQLMANFCGIGYNIGYSGLVEQMVGVNIDKKLQNSNWQRRPLSEQQIEYALLDVFYVEEIYEKLWQDLALKKREKWFLEDMESAVKSTLAVSDENLVKNFIKGKKSYKNNPQKLAKISNLILWRDKTARQNDIARRFLLSDDDMQKIVETGDVNVRIKSEFKDEIREILACDFEPNFAIDLEFKSSIMNEEQKDKYQQARDLIAKIAQQENFKEQFLINSATLKDIILKKQRPYEALNGWRYFLFGTKLEKLIA